MISQDTNTLKPCEICPGQIRLGPGEIWRCDSCSFQMCDCDFQAGSVQEPLAWSATFPDGRRTQTGTELVAQTFEKCGAVITPLFAAPVTEQAIRRKALEELIATLAAQLTRGSRFDKFEDGRQAGLSDAISDAQDLIDKNGGAG